MFPKAERHTYKWSYQLINKPYNIKLKHQLFQMIFMKRSRGPAYNSGLRPLVNFVYLWYWLRRDLYERQKLFFSSPKIQELNSLTTFVLRNINNLRNADDTTLMAETKGVLKKAFLMKVKRESEKAWCSCLVSGLLLAWVSILSSVFLSRVSSGRVWHDWSGLAALISESLSHLSPALVPHPELTSVDLTSSCLT